MGTAGRGTHSVGPVYIVRARLGSVYRAREREGRTCSGWISVSIRRGLYYNGSVLDGSYKKDDRQGQPTNLSS